MSKLRDLVERTAWTAVQAFAGVWAGLSITGTVDWKATVISAGIAALIAAAKCVVAFQFGNSDSAALPETRPE